TSRTSTVSVRVCSEVRGLGDGDRVRRTREVKGTGHIDSDVFVQKVGVIEGIEGIQAKLQVADVAFSQRDVFKQGEIPVFHPSSSQCVASAANGRANGWEQDVSLTVEAVEEWGGSKLVRAGEASRRERELVVEVNRRSGHELGYAAQLKIVGHLGQPPWA